MSPMTKAELADKLTALALPDTAPADAARTFSKLIEDAATLAQADNLAEALERYRSAERVVESWRAALEAPYVRADQWDPGPPPEAVVTVRAGKPKTVFPVLRRGEVGILGGAGGTGKTWLALGIASATGKGGHHAGFDVAEGGAIVWSAEGGAEGAARRLRSLPGGGRFVFVARPPKPLLADYGEGVEPTPDGYALRDMADEVKPALVVVDPILSALDIESANAARPVRAAVAWLTEIAEASGAAVLILHHSTKAGRYGAGGLQNMHPDEVAAHALSGSREFFDAPRSAMFLYRRESGAEVLGVKANAGRTGWAVQLRADVERRADGTERFLRWERSARLPAGCLRTCWRPVPIRRASARHIAAGSGVRLSLSVG